MKLDKYKQAIADEYLRSNKNIFVNASAGCFGKDTPILMYDGSIKMVQDVKVGDQVMGMDSLPRNVLSINNGVSKLFKVIPNKGESWICNDSHIFTVWDDSIAGIMRTYKKTKYKTAFVDYPLDYVRKRVRPDGTIRQLQLQRCAVEYSERRTPIDPYLLGLWLAEGTKNPKVLPQFSINEKDVELQAYLLNLKNTGYGVSVKINRGTASIVINKGIHKENFITKELRRVWDNKDFDLYKINSRNCRLDLLAGLIDGDGYLDGKVYEITTKYTELRDLILYICRSVGLAAYSHVKIGKIKELNFSAEYHNIIISGNTDIIPCKLKRKHSSERKQVKSVLRVGFRIMEQGYGEWFGFSVDGDHRFLLSDFTVVHNSGKTSLLLHLLNITPSYKDCLFLAFNRSIVEELERKCLGRAEVKTIHSKAYSTLLKNKKCTFKLSKWRDYSICKKYLSPTWSIDPKCENSRIMNISRIYQFMRMNLIDIDDFEMLESVCARWDVDFDSSYYKDMRKFIEAIDEETNHLRVNKLDIDFTDQLYLAYKYVPAELYPKYDVIFCDEAQDLNVLQRELILRMLKENGRLITVGDEMQAIYGFQGCSVDSFKAFEMRPNTISLPLNLTYRCAKRIVDVARKYSPDIEAKEDANEGEVREGSLDEVRNGDYIICRNNLPLVETFIKLLGEGKKSVILGKDYGESILLLLNRVESERGLLELLREKKDELIERGIKNFSMNESYVVLLEKVQILLLLNRRYGSFQEVKKVLTDIFGDESKDKILLSTIHKSKGLEADRVFILGFHELIPSKYATTELALYGERCLQFVAVTRAKNTLIFLPYKEKNEKTEIVH